MAPPYKIPRPHWLIFHPHLTLRDKIVSALINFVLYMLSLSGLPQMEMGSEEMKRILSRAQTTFENGGKSGSKAVVKEWSDATEAPSPSSPGAMAESSGSIPFRKNVLREWNIIDENTRLPDAALKDRKAVGVLVRFPSSLMSDEAKNEATVLEDSECLGIDFDKVDWRTFCPEVPVLIQFHGGGMTIGNANDSMLVKDTARLVQNSSSSGPRDIITVSVDYGLAPEDPFPIGVMDALSVVDYFLRDNSVRKGIHLTGTSAGGNLSLVAGFEGFRKFPGRILSIQSNSPFLDPSCASMSFYMNQNAFPDSRWLCWSWQAYLGLEKPSPTASGGDDGDSDDETELEKVLRKGSNHTAWEKWKNERYPSEAVHRLVNPLLGIPEGLDDDDESNETRPPKIIVRYNRGDPLYDDGKATEVALRGKAGSNATCYDEPGLHCGVSSPYDPDAPQEYWKVWSDAIFGGSE